MGRHAPYAMRGADLAIHEAHHVLMLEIARRTRISSRPQLGAISSSRCQKTRAPHPRRAKSDTSGRAKPAGGARRDRTDDLLLAKQALSQLSYGPVARRACHRSSRKVVGLGRFELPTSRL